MELVLKVVVALVVASYMFEAGFATPPRELANVARRRPEIAAAIFVMLVIGPMLAYAIVRTLDLGVHDGAALILLSFVGVVPLASKMARKAKGDVCFALVLTLVLGALAPFTAPSTARLIFAGQRGLQIDAGPLLLKLVLIEGLPILAGLGF